MADTNCIPLQTTPPDSDRPYATPVRSWWQETGAADHFVQFYRDDELLVKSVADFMAAGLRIVEGGIIVATKAHRKAITERLATQGLDLTAATARKQFVVLDAEATLATFMVDGMPDEKLFHRTVGYVVTRMLSSGYRVRAFGEMVALLCANDNPTAALRLEQLWNDLAKVRRFSLFCAYPMAQFPGGASDPVFQHVCAAHTAVIPIA